VVREREGGGRGRGRGKKCGLAIRGIVETHASAKRLGHDEKPVNESKIRKEEKVRFWGSR
jgi:hypothetical protein